MKRSTVFITSLLIAIPLLTLLTNYAQEKQDTEKINGVNFVSSRYPMTRADAQSVVDLGSNFVSIIPYAFIPGHVPEVIFDSPNQWYGERVEGTIQMIHQARAKALKIMLKPHVWVRGDGWAGDFTLKSEEEWQQWEKAFDTYILTYAKIADSLQVEVFCFATEFRQVVKNRPTYWPKLITKVRKLYSGKLTYAANWDNYENVQFWNKLDYIGIDAYFPICDKKTPDVEDLISLWQPVKYKIRDLSLKHQKPILFTEYGYQSIDFSASEHWNIENGAQTNMIAQKNGYEAIFKTYWNEPWFAGGFLWKWFPNHDNAGGLSNKRFTPQNKPAQSIVTEYYKTYAKK